MKLCVLLLLAAMPGYPPEWWKEVPRSEAKSWEILPQDAGTNEVILSKRTELGVLSNLAPTPFEFHGRRYASLEGFWQAMKFPEGSAERARVEQMSGFEAKHAGDAAGKVDWVSFEGERFEYRPKQPGRHYQLIVAATRAKVEQNAEVKRVLLATGNLVLKPDHRQEPNPLAAWRYNEILMQIRAELQKQ